MTFCELTIYNDNPLLIRLCTELDLYRILSGFHRTFATGVACRQGTLTPLDTWSCPFGTCICSTCWDQSFSELVIIFPDYALRISLGTFSILHQYNPAIVLKTKRRRSDPVLWQKPLYQQKCQRGKVATQTTQQKGSIKQKIADRLRTVSWSNYSHPTGVVNRFTGPPSHSPQQPCNQKYTHLKICK